MESFMEIGNIFYSDLKYIRCGFYHKKRIRINGFSFHLKKRQENCCNDLRIMFDFSPIQSPVTVLTTGPGNNLGVGWAKK